MIYDIRNKTLNQIKEEHGLTEDEVEWIEQIVCMGMTLRQQINLRKKHDKEVENEH